MYVKGHPTPNIKEYLDRELTAIEQAFRSVSLMQSANFDEQFNEPKKPRNGVVSFADGTSWNPGSGRGLYIYDGGIWTQVVAL